MAGERPNVYRDGDVVLEVQPMAGERRSPDWYAGYERALMDAAAPSPEPLPLDVPRVAKAVENVARRHGIVKDPPAPLAVMRIWGYSAAPLEMDAEIAAEYAALSPDRPT